MIKDNIKNAEKYYKLSPSIEKAFEFLQKNDLLNMPAGRYEIEGNEIYVNLDEYETRVSSNIEAHQEYIDIQLLLSGEEYMGVSSLDNLTIIEPYNKEKDITFYNGDCEKILVRENEFIIFYPEDAHLPCQMVDMPRKNKKAVAKIKK